MHVLKLTYCSGKSSRPNNFWIIVLSGSNQDRDLMMNETFAGFASQKGQVD